MDKVEKERREKLRSEMITKAKALRKQTHDNLFKQVEDFRPTLNDFEQDVVAGVQAYLDALHPSDRDDKSVSLYATDYTYEHHPGDMEFRYELASRLLNIVNRRRLNMNQMGCGLGWEDLIHSFLDKVELLPGFRLKDATEKFGMLQIKYSVDDPTLVEQAKRQAVEQSLHTCEVCGEEGRLRKKGWWKTVCDKHADVFLEHADPHHETKLRYSDVYAPDPEPYTRGLEFKYGWAKILRGYLDTLRGWDQSGFSVKLRWGKEKFGCLRLFDNLNLHTATRLQVYQVERLNEWSRRKSLQTCDMCGRSGRLRWGNYLATRCDEHAADMGGMREEDGIVLDADRQRYVDGKAVMHQWALKDWTDKELAINREESTWDGAKQFSWDFAPMLAADVELPDDDNQLYQLRPLLMAVDKAIGKYREIEFKLTAWGDRTSYTIGIDPIYKEHAVSTVDEIMRSQIHDDIHSIMSGAA